MELEGLRGLAAIVVVIYHSLLMFYPGVAYGHNSILAPMQNMRFEDNLYGNPVNVLLSGGFAVAIFFVLSGFVLSIGFFQTKKESIIKRLASKRYLRLMLPALVSAMLAFLLIAGGLSVNRQGTVDIAQSGHLAGLWNFTPHFIDAFYEGITSVFLKSGGVYNTVLWTMYYEFIGSFIIFTTLLVFGLSKYRWVAYGALAVTIFNTWFFGIVLGMILADLYSHRSKRWVAITRKTFLMWTVLISGLLVGGYPMASTEGTFYQILHIPALTDGQNVSLYLSVGAALIVTAVLYLNPLARSLSHPKVAILGRYTYSLYLTHTLVLYTLGTTLFVLFAHHLSINKSALFAVTLTVPVIILATWLFEKYIDAPSIRFANFFSDILFDQRELDLRLKQRIQNGKIYAMEAVSRMRRLEARGLINNKNEMEE